jgi:hypothetical protein
MGLHKQSIYYSNSDCFHKPQQTRNNLLVTLSTMHPLFVLVESFYRIFVGSLKILSCN